MAAGLLVAACSSSKSSAPLTTAATGGTDASTTVAGTDAPTTVAGPAGSPVVVAALLDVTGPSPVPDGTAKIFDAWAAYISAKGGVNGHPVKFEVRDTKGDAASAQSALDELLALKPIAIMLDTPSTESALADSLKKSGIPVMGTGYNPAVWGGSIEAFKLKCSTDAGAPVPSALPNAFPITTTFGAVVDEQALGAKAAGATITATAACAEVDSCSAAAPVFTATATAIGLKDTGVTKVSSVAASYTAECVKWIQDKVDFIELSGSSQMGVKIFNDCTAQGYTGTFGASAGAVSGDLLTQKGLVLAGGLNAFPWWVDDAPVAEFRDAMKAAGVTEAEYGNSNSTGLWSSLQLLAKAVSTVSSVTATSDLTSANVLDGLYSLKDETLGGLISPVTFTKGQLAASRDCFWPFILKDGKFTNTLGGLKYQCNPPAA